MMQKEQKSVHDPDPPKVFQIRIQGHLSQQWMDWFEGLRPTKRPDTNHIAVDGSLARQLRFIPGEADRHLTSEQRARRDSLERAVFLHREKKGQMPEAEYYQQLEQILLELARFYGGFTLSRPATNGGPSGNCNARWKMDYSWG